MSYRDELVETIWEAAYIANGVKPRWMKFDDMSIEELESSADYYEGAADAELERLKIEQVENIKSFESSIKDTISMGAGNVKTALRWMMDSVNADDYGYFEYNMGLPYGYINKYKSSEGI